MGGRGASAKVGENREGGSALERMKKVASQFNAAKRKAIEGNYAELHFEDPLGKVRRSYWNGSTCGDRKSDMALRYSKRKGVLKVKFHN